jgi:hypothetical protein
VRGFERVDALGQDFDLRRFVVFGGAQIVVIGLQLGQRVMIAGGFNQPQKLRPVATYTPWLCGTSRISGRPPLGRIESV